jgi:hypothetical protein
MREIVEFSVDEILPDRDAVLAAMEVAAEPEPPERISKLADDAISTFRGLSRSRGVIEAIALGEFASIHRGEGRNETRTPLASIFPQATHLTLFAATVGAEVSERIDDLFHGDNFALGYALDAVASLGAENAADKLEARFGEWLYREGFLKPSTAHLRYSPGYCGWHISGQRKLFSRLKPEAIDIELADSFLMQPLKSISGVIVFGKKEIHLFADNYPFCSECTTHTCRDRIKHMLNPA